jgi:hypothetical protein
MVAPARGGGRGARREQRRAARVSPPPPRGPLSTKDVVGDPLDEVRMRLTYRTARVIGCIAARPGASNRAVAQGAGVSDPGQISKLLRRLERLGLAANIGGGHQSGEPNAWELTPLGCQVARRLSVLTSERIEAA